MKPRLRRWRRSLGARLTALFLLFAFLVVVTFVGGTQSAFRAGWQGYARPLVGDYIDRVVAEIGTPPDPARAQALSERLPLRIRIEGPAVNWSSHPERDRRDDERRAHHRNGSNDWRPSRTLTDGHRITFSLANPAHDDDDNAPEDRQRLIGWATLAILLLLTGLAYHGVRRLLRPLDDINLGAQRYGAGDFSTPIRPRRNDELGDLAAQINRMADGLHGMLDAKRQLLLAISHELRSPLTRARLNAELVDDSAARDALLHDLSEMRDLITDLLESERLAAGHAALHTEPVDLNTLVCELLAGSFDGRAITTTFDDALPTLALDATRIRVLLRNLLDNALRHSSDAPTPPQLTTARDGDGVRVTVRDHGPGVSDAELARLTEAFYRTDSARGRSTGGVGLGLHLSALIARAHGGELTLRHAHPGLQAELTLPASPAAATSSL